MFTPWPKFGRPFRLQTGTTRKDVLKIGRRDYPVGGGSSWHGFFDVDRAAKMMGPSCGRKRSSSSCWVGRQEKSQHSGRSSTFWETYRKKKNPDRGRRSRRRWAVLHMISIIACARTVSPEGYATLARYIGRDSTIWKHTFFLYKKDTLPSSLLLVSHSKSQRAPETQPFFLSFFLSFCLSRVVLHRLSRLVLFFFWLTSSSFKKRERERKKLTRGQCRTRPAWII